MGPCSHRASHAPQKKSLKPIRHAGGAEKNAVGPPFFSEPNEDLFGIARLHYCFSAQSVLSQLFRCGFSKFPRMLTFFEVALFDRLYDGRNEFSYDRSFEWLIDNYNADFAFVRPAARGHFFERRFRIFRSIKPDDKPHGKVRLIDFSAGNAD